MMNPIHGCELWRNGEYVIHTPNSPRYIKGVLMEWEPIKGKLYAHKEYNRSPWAAIEGSSFRVAEDYSCELPDWAYWVD